MPKGTKVEKCFTELKSKMGVSSAASICQKSTGQSLSTGKSLSNSRSSRKSGKGKRK